MCTSVFALECPPSKHRNILNLTTLMMRRTLCALDPETPWGDTQERRKRRHLDQVWDPRLSRHAHTQSDQPDFYGGDFHSALLFINFLAFCYPNFRQAKDHLHRLLILILSKQLNWQIGIASLLLLRSLTSFSPTNYIFKRDQ